MPVRTLQSNNMNALENVNYDFVQEDLRGYTCKPRQRYEIINNKGGENKGFLNCYIPKNLPNHRPSIGSKQWQNSADYSIKWLKTKKTKIEHLLCHNTELLLQTSI